MPPRLPAPGQALCRARHAATAGRAGAPLWRGLIAAARRTRRQRLMAAGAQTGSAPVRKPAFAAARALKVMAFIRAPAKAATQTEILAEDIANALEPNLEK